MGIAESGINDLIYTYNVTKYSQLYQLPKEINLRNGKEILKSIEKSRQCRLSRFLYAISIPGIGKEQSDKLAKVFKDINTLMTELPTFTEIQLKENGLSPLTQARFIEYVNENDLTELLQHLTFIDDNVSDVLRNEVIAFTGTFESIRRSELSELLSKHGATIKTTLGKSTTLLIVGQNPSDKLQRALEMNIPTCSIDELNKQLNLKII